MCLGWAGESVYREGLTGKKYRGLGRGKCLDIVNMLWINRDVTGPQLEEYRRK